MKDITVSIGIQTAESVIVGHFCLPLKLPCPEITHELIRAYFLYMI